MDNDRGLRVPLTGYSDRLSARAGDTIAFKLSAAQRRKGDPALVKSWLMHSVCADANPAGPGIIERNASKWYTSAQHEVIEQAIVAGSCALSTPVALPSELTHMELSATLWPTLLSGGQQCVMALGSVVLFIGDDNCLQCSFGEHVIRMSEALVERQWVCATACLEQQADNTLILSVSCFPVSRQWGGVDSNATKAKAEATATADADHRSVSIRIPFNELTVGELEKLKRTSPPVTIAAQQIADTLTHHFNGKIEAPELRINCSTTSNAAQHSSSTNTPKKSQSPSFSEHSSPSGTPDIEDSDAHTSQPLKRIAWNLAQNMASNTINDVEEHGITLKLINAPTRAMKGSAWGGEEMCWRHAPDQYAAIHFHDDDLVDANWQTSFNYTLPEDIPSGVYIMRISDGRHEDAMPFFVCAPKGATTNRLCVLVSTFTYAIYGNHARPDWQASWQDKMRDWNAYPYNPAMYPGYGLSTYNYHSDGSGICHASHLRPLFNLRPGYITFGNTQCSGIRHFQADSHLLAWLDTSGIGYDVITDRELHDEGITCIEDYDMLLTGSHPEYHTAQTLNALQSYRDTGGHLSYLGGNGFYWRIALHPEQQDTLEIRRAEAGIRAWASEPGEYYHAFDGQYGGLWRRNGRPPQALVGLGFSAQGEFHGSCYRRTSTDSSFDWMFKGIDEDIIGNFGLCGGGAAGFELDRADTRLGTPANATVLARSEGHGQDFILVPEEMLTHLTTLPGPSAEELIHADILWCDMPGGGSIFSVGSITFCGSLPYNNFDNSVSQLLLNVVVHVLGERQG